MWWLMMPPRLLPSRVPDWIIDPIVRLLVALRLTPNILTFAGLVGSAIAGVLVANDVLLGGGILLLLSGALDLFDGALARATGRAGPIGALLDSTVDRFSEAIVLFGVLFYELERGNREESALVFVAVVGSLLVSYVRSRAGELGVQLTEGLLTRPERIILLAVGLITGWLRPTLWILAILTVATALQRLYLAVRVLRTEAVEGGD
jgi:CDP-diacylglycerol--glycerol-3-phosphate 3-phosphatidyltransferase